MSMKEERCGDLTIVRDELGTSVYDEEGEVVFLLPGKCSTKLVKAVHEIQRRAHKNGAEIGRFSLQREFAKLLNLPTNASVDRAIREAQEGRAP